MSELILPLEQLTEQMRRLPGVGRKTALKYAMRLLELPEEEAETFARTVLEARHKIKRCRRCFNLSEEELCAVCADPGRDQSLICVVEDVRAVMAMERVREYRGTYHVLEGLLSPMEGKGPDQLRIAELMERVRAGDVREVIVATNPTAEGETTAMYLSRLLKGQGVAVTRLAYGIPVGADLEFADEVTLARALSGRRELND